MVIAGNKVLRIFGTEDEIIMGTRDVSQATISIPHSKETGRTCFLKKFYINLDILIFIVLFIDVILNCYNRFFSIKMCKSW